MDEVALLYRNRFFLEEVVWDYVMWADQSFYTPKWKWISDPLHKGRVTAVVDNDERTTMEQVRTLVVRKGRSKNASICPSCQKDIAVVHVLQNRK